MSQRTDRERETSLSWYGQGLRTRFKPRARLSQGYLSMAPWVDIILLFVLLVLCLEGFVLRAGVVIQLPVAEFRDGVPIRGEAVVVVVRPDVDQGTLQEIIFFRDQPYKPETDLMRLKGAFEKVVKDGQEGVLTIEADSAVTQGTLVRIWDAARNAGIATVNVATRTPGNGGEVSE